MAIKHGSKVDKSFSASSMTDLMFLLLLFLLIATTLINPNALKLMLPKSANQLKDKAITTVSIQQAGSGYNYYVELEKVSGIDGVEQALRVAVAAVRAWLKDLSWTDAGVTFSAPADLTEELISTAAHRVWSRILFASGHHAASEAAAETAREFLATLVGRMLPFG